MCYVMLCYVTFILSDNDTILVHNITHLFLLYAHRIVYGIKFTRTKKRG